MKSRVLTLDSNGVGTVGVPPARWAGMHPFAGITAQNLGRDLTTNPDSLSPATEQLVSGDIAISGGTPDSNVTLFMHFPT